MSIKAKYGTMGVNTCKYVTEMCCYLNRLCGTLNLAHFQFVTYIVNFCINKKTNLAVYMIHGCFMQSHRFTFNTWAVIALTCICSDLWWLLFQELLSSAVGLPDLWIRTACSMKIINVRQTQRQKRLHTASQSQTFSKSGVCGRCG